MWWTWKINVLSWTALKTLRSSKQNWDYWFLFLHTLTVQQKGLVASVFFLNYFTLVACLPLCISEHWITEAQGQHLFLSCCDWSPTSSLTFTFFRNQTDFSCWLMSCTVCYRAYESVLELYQHSWVKLSLLLVMDLGFLEKMCIVTSLSHLPDSLYTHFWLVKHELDITMAKTDSNL